MRAGYNVGGITDGSHQGFGPNDLRYIQEKFLEGSATPNMMISFNADFNPENALNAVKGGIGSDPDGQNSIYLYDMKCSFQTPTLSLRSQSLFRSGTTQVTPVWGIIPKCRASVFLMSRLHTNVIDKITVFHLSYAGSDHSVTKPVVTEVKDFEHCLVVYVEPFGQGDFTVFAFTFVKLTWAIKDFKQDDKNNVAGQRVYVFDYSTGEGAFS